MEWEEEVAELPPPAHKNSPRRLSWCGDLRCLCDRDPWSLLSETFGLRLMLFDFWGLRLPIFKCLIYYVTIYN